MTNTILTLARFSLLEALRTRLGLLSLALLLIGLALAWLTGQMAITETREIQSVLTASFFRLVAAFLIASFICTAQAREAADKGIDMLLSLAAPRAAYYLGRLMGYIGLAVALAVVFGLPLLLLAPAAAVMTWTVALALELAIVAAASLFFVTTLAQVPAALAAVGAFYLLSRAMAALQLIGGGSLVNDGSLVPKAIEQSLDFVAAILPRLDLYTQSNWLAETPMVGVLPGLAAQAMVYVAFLSVGGLFDLYRKNF